MYIEIILFFFCFSHFRKKIEEFFQEIDWLILL